MGISRIHGEAVQLKIPSLVVVHACGRNETPIDSELVVRLPDQGHSYLFLARNPFTSFRGIRRTETPGPPFLRPISFTIIWVVRRPFLSTFSRSRLAASWRICAGLACFWLSATNQRGILTSLFHDSSTARDFSCFANLAA